MKTNLGSASATNPPPEHERVRSARRGLLAFFAMLIPLSILSYVLILKNPMFVLLLMWSPGIAAIFARLLLHEGVADISLRFGGKRTLKTLPFILLLPAVVGLIAYGTAWIAGLVEFATPETSIKASPAVVFIGLLLMQMFGGTALGVISSFGEELGWRGYMLTRLIDARVPYPMLVSGIIWGLWHLPVMLAGQYYSGPYPALSVVLFMITITSFGFIIGRLRLTTGSLWAAVLLHASWNAVIQDVFDASSKGDNALLWTGESGIFVTVVLVIAALWICRRPMNVTKL